MHARDAGGRRRGNARRGDDAGVAGNDQDARGQGEEEEEGASTKTLTYCSFTPRLDSSYRARVTARWTLPLVVRPTVPLGTSATSSTNSPKRSPIRRRTASTTVSDAMVPLGS